MGSQVRFLTLETLGGLLLIGSSALAMILANSTAADSILHALRETVTVRYGDVGLEKPLLLWINDGLMAVFFLLIGLELKRQALEGELSSFGQVVLPGAAALGGIVVPTLIFVALNRDDPVALRGWAIPAATDIAFALGVLAMVGSRVPIALKTFLMTLAVFDDIAAILIIAIFYSGDISWTAHLVAAGATATLIALNRLAITRLGPYLLVGAVLWVAVLRSGVHATVAGVVLGLTIPLRAVDAFGHSPLKHLEHVLHPYVALLILPAFAFANAGVSLAGVSGDALVAPVTLGIALGLVVGKTVGVFAAAALMIRTGLAKMPTGANWRALLGTSLLAGVGFTMSLFIGTLAYENHGPGYGVQIRIGVIGGSLVAAFLGFCVVRSALPPRAR